MSCGKFLDEPVENSNVNEAKEYNEEVDKETCIDIVVKLGVTGNGIARSLRERFEDEKEENWYNLERK